MAIEENAGRCDAMASQTKVFLSTTVESWPFFPIGSRHRL